MDTAAQTQPQQRILQAAFNMFCQRGIRGVSMDDIAQYLAMSKKTLYKWFKNKDQVVFDSTETYITTIQTECEAFANQTTNAIDELFHLMALTKQVLSVIHPSVFNDLQKYHPESWELWMRHKNSFMLETVKRNIERGMQEGLFRNDLDVDVMARMRLAMIDLPFNADIFPPNHYSISQVQLAVLEHYMLGMATLKGHKLINMYKEVTEEE